MISIKSGKKGMNEDLSHMRSIDLKTKVQLKISQLSLKRTHETPELLIGLWVCKRREEEGRVGMETIPTC